MKNRFITWTILMVLTVGLKAQTRVLKLDEAVQLGIRNSKQLKLSHDKIEAALARVEQAKDLSLPAVKVNAGFSEALMLTQKFYLPSTDGTPKSVDLSFGYSLYQAGLGISQPIFNGHQFQYARASADLLFKISTLDSEKDKDEVAYQVINAYINYYKICQNQKVIRQNQDDINQKLEEIRKFEKQGLAIHNDVLNFELELANMDLLAANLETNRSIANYSMNILLGLPDSTRLQVEEIGYKLDGMASQQDYLQQALLNRKEFKSYQFQDKLAEVNIKTIQGQKLPTVSVAGNLYYINPTKNFIPKSGTYLAPFLVGVNVGWDITGFLTNKNKITEARVQKKEVTDNRDMFTDEVKTNVNKAYLEYQDALQKIKILQTSISKAVENERITESRYHNNLATTTERIDAQTTLFRSRIALELAKADATLAYYSLLHQTGQILN